jgi:hypothetical protein
MLEMSTESKFLGRWMKTRIGRCMIHIQKTSRRTTGTSAIRCVHVNVLLTNLSRPHTSRARSPDSLNSTAFSRTARPQHIRATFSSSTNHIRTPRENDPPPTLRRKRARHLPPPCSPRPYRELKHPAACCFSPAPASP